MFLEKIGTVNPLGKKGVTIDEEKARKWLASGAQLSPAVRGLFKKAGVFEPAPNAAETATEAASAEAAEASEA